HGAAFPAKRGHGRPQAVPIRARHAKGQARRRTRYRHCQILVRAITRLIRLYAPCLSPAVAGDGWRSNNRGENWPPIRAPRGITGTPARSGSLESDMTPSRKTLITVARRGAGGSFAREPCIVRAWGNELSPFFNSMATGSNLSLSPSGRVSRMPSISPVSTGLGKSGHLWLPGT